MYEESCLRILFVEDLPPDHELAEAELRKGGICFESKRVDNRDEYIRAIHEFNPDMIISDYSLPEFDGMQAMRILFDYDSSIPFIVLTGTLNEEIAVECMKSGATDYVLKEHIGKLPFAVREAVNRRDAVIEKIKIMDALQESEQRYRSMFENNHAVMLILGGDSGVIINANRAAMDFYGYTRDEFLGKALTDISVYEKSIVINKIRLAIADIEHHYFSKHRLADGRIRDVEIFIGPITYMGQSLLYTIIHDVTERKLAESALQASLKQKTDLIREVYHRTKNSLQVILSILSLQSIYSRDVNVVNVLRDMESRIRAMALVHEKLYKSENLSRIRLDDYIMELIPLIKLSSGTDKKEVVVKDDLDSIEVLIDTAIPCGLVLNEILSNSFKHAFQFRDSGEIIIKLKADDSGNIELSVSDNGCGVEGEFDYKTSGSLGMKIIDSIVDYQLRGDIVFSSADGVSWLIRFKDNIYEERI